jgi:hypothetical protein
MNKQDYSISTWTIVSTATEECLAVIRDENTGQCIRLDWSRIEPHWDYANFEGVEFCSADIIGNCLVLCLTTAGGQGGLAAVWDLVSSSWVQISYNPFIVACLPLQDLELALYLVFVDNVYSSVKRGYRLYAEPLDGSILSEQEKSMEIEIVECTPPTRQFLISLGQRFVLNPSLTNEALVGIFYDPTSQKVFIYDENNIKASALLDSSIISAVHSL